MTDPDAQQRAAFPPPCAGILSARSLEADYPHLAASLHPGLRVLDVGCGTGAITAGMAAAVAPGTVMGLDAGEALLERARQQYSAVPNLTFVQGDIYRLDDYAGQFDVVAARVLGWLAQPERAVGQLARALRPGGRLFLLDYHHHQARLTPPPGPAMTHFRSRYLAWRADAGMDNAVAGRLADLLAAAGLLDIQVVPQPETTMRGDPDFARRVRMWGDIAATRGHQVVADGYVHEHERQAAVDEHARWMEQAQSQMLVLTSAVGRRPASPRLP